MDAIFVKLFFRGRVREILLFRNPLLTTLATSLMDTPKSIQSYRDYRAPFSRVLLFIQFFSLQISVRKSEGRRCDAIFAKFNRIAKRTIVPK